MAKDLVRTRNNITKFYKMRTELQAVSLRIAVSCFIIVFVIVSILWTGCDILIALLIALPMLPFT